MQKSLLVVRYLIVIVVVFALVGLLGWYFFLKSRTSTTVALDDARGLDSTAPSFTGSTGSTYENIAQTTVEDTGQVSAETVSAPPQLWRVSQTPTSGMGFVEDSAFLKVYFVERASGNVFSADVINGKVERLTNTLLPRTYSAAITRDGAVALRGIDDGGKTTLFAGTIPPKTAPATAEISSSSPVAMKGTSLAADVSDLAINPKTNEVFYVLPDAKIGAIGIRSSWDGKVQKRVLESGIIGWRPLWLSDGRIVLTQYPAYDLPGNAYVLESGGTLTPLIRNIPGLTILPRASSKTFVYGTATGGTIAMYVQKEKKEPELLPIKTIADKCVWAPKKEFILYCAVPQTLGSGNFIDNYLQGRIHTSDTWWEVNTADGTAQIFFVSDSSSGAIDVIQPTIDENGKYISFMNGFDQSLWVLRMPTNTENTAASVI